jgi:uracil-DNA glycosylase
MATYVCGHRNPDTDSIVSAIALASLHKTLGEDGYCYYDTAIQPGESTGEMCIHVELPEEAEACRIHLRMQTYLVRPKVIVLLGATAARYTLDPNIRITRDRGKWTERKGVWLLPTFHPSALLRDETKKAAAWEDMQRLRDKLIELKLYPDLLGSGQ